MECVTAQQVISSALDREPVDTYQLEEAKQHCRTCPECGVFVRAQLVAQQLPLPEPPAGLADRVMVRVRGEAQAAADAQAAAGSAAALAEARAAARRPVRVGYVGAPAGGLAPSPRPAFKLPRMWVSAAAALAVIVALIGTGAIVIFGMRQMNGPAQSTSGIYQGALPEASSPSGASPLGATPYAGARGGKAAGAQSITVGGVVYKEVGASTLDTSTASIVGFTNSTLGGAAIKKRDVWAKSSMVQDAAVYVADDTGVMLQFAPVTRTYAGLTFLLTSTEITGLDQWPGLPAQITQPTSADGQPTFVFDGTDSAGVRVYRMANSTVTQGIAVGPNTPSTDPAGGNPNWTWWSPSR